MKKIYMKPVARVMFAQVEDCLLAGSNPNGAPGFNVGPQETPEDTKDGVIGIIQDGELEDLYSKGHSSWTTWDD